MSQPSSGEPSGRQPAHLTEAQLAAVRDLLHGEAAAMATYDQALALLDERKEYEPVDLIRQEHENALATLRELAAEYDVDADVESSPWELWAKAVEGAASLFGASGALKGLRLGEEYGIHRYEDAIAGSNLPETFVSLLRHELLPRQYEHVKVLVALEEMASS